jgi:hypothetical protein
LFYAGIAEPDSVKYNGAKFTYLGGSGLTQLWGLLNPSSGSHSMQVYSNAGHIWASVAVSYTNVNQSVPLGTVVTKTGSSTADSVSASSNVNDVVVAAFGNNGNGESHVSDGTGQLNRVYSHDGAGEDVYFADLPGVTTTTKAKGHWSNSISWTDIGVALKAP